MKRLQNLSYKTLFIILFFSLAGIVFFLKIGGKTTKVSAAWWDDSWHYRQAISIGNSSGSNLTDFQVSLSIGTSQLIADGKMQTDCDDIRVTDINGNLLPYWVETTGTNKCNQIAGTRVWFKANSIPTSGSTIYIYYGNPSATSQSSGENTFIYFKDNFQTSDVGWNWSHGGVENGWAKTWATSADNPGSTMTWLKNIINITGQEVIVEFTTKAAKSGSTGHFTTNVLFNPTQTTGLYNNTNNSTIANGSGNSIITTGDYSGWYGKAGLDTTTGQANNITNDTAYPTYQFNTDGWIRHVHKLTNSSLLLSGYSLGGLSVGTSAWTYNEKTITSGYTKPNNIILAIGEQYYENVWLSEVFIHKYASSTPTISSQSEESGGGPIAYWKFDEGIGTTAYDSAGNNNGFFGTGNSAPTWQTEDQCIFGKCLSFNGSNTILQIPNSSNLDIKSSDITLSAWIKINNCTDANGIVHKNNQYSVAIYPSGNICQLTYADSSNWSYASFGKYGSITKNVWHHIAATKNSSNVVTLYLDGNILTSKSFGSTISSTSNPVYIGSYINGSTGYFFNGLIDEPKIYPYARTAAQIKLDYNSRGSTSSKGSGVNMGTNKNNNSLTDGLVGYWKMDEGVGTSITDSSGNNNTGTFGNGSSAPSWSNGKYGIGLSFATNQYTQISSIVDTTIKSYSYWIYQTSAAGSQAALTSNNLYHMASYGGVNDLSTLFPDDQKRKCNSTIPLNSWSFIYLDLINDKIYLNGIDCTTTAVIGWAHDPFTGLIIGKSYINYGAPLGKMDEIRAYNRALSPAEVTQLYNYAPGPVVYYDFNENTGAVVNDRSGNNINASFNTSGSTPVWIQGKNSGGLSFDGSSSFLTANLGNKLLRKSYTFEAWAKPNNTTSNNIFWIANPNQVQISLNNSLTRLYTNTNHQASYSFSPTSWNHLSYVYDYGSTSVSFYVNGINIGSTYYSNNGNIGNILNIGSSGWGWQYYKGSIDDVKIYNYARTQKQIIEDMTGGAPAASAKSVLAYYKFDEGSGITANNSGNGGSALNGTFGTGNSAPTWINEGKKGKALSFNGTSNYILTNQKFTSDELTWSAWVKTAANGTIAGTNYGNAPTFWHGGIAIVDNKANMQIGYISTYRSIPGTSNITDSKWHHIVMTSNSSGSYLYVDGKQEAYSSYYVGQVPGSSEQGTCIGVNCMFGYSSTNFFNGLIDEVKFYNYALTADEVKQDYNQNSTIQFGTTNQTIGGTTTSLNYCIPGDTSYCAAPVAEWNFEENTGTTTKDTSSNNNNGTFGTGNSAPTWAVGAKNKGAGINFDGKQYITIPDSNSIKPTTAITVESWFNTNDKSSYQKILSKTEGSGYALIINETSSVCGSNSLCFGINFGGTYYGATYSLNNISNNNWYHLTGVYDGNTVKLFLNGINVGTTSTITSSITQGAYNLCIGSETNGGNCSNGGSFFKGKIDGIKIYNYARTPAQIAYDYNRGDPIAWWKFNECQGSTIFDSSGLGSSGVISIGLSGSQTSLGTCQTGTSAAWTNGSNGRFNGSLNLDGSDDFVTIPSSIAPKLGSSNFTVSFWTYRTSSGYQYGSYISKGGYTNGIDTYDNIFRVNTSSGELAHVTLSANLNTWEHHLFVVSQTSTPYISHYINGILNNTGYVGVGNTGTYPADSYDLVIGKSTAGGVNRLFNGQIDDIRFYNYTLTPEQVKQVYKGGAVNFQ